MKTFICETLGCKVNRYETEGLSERLKSDQWRIAEDGAKADLCIINTCTVTGKAAMQSRQTVRKVIRNHPGAVIIVTGCYAQIASDVLATIPGIDWIVGHSHKHRIPELIGNASQHSRENILVASVLRTVSFQDLPITTFGTRARAFVKIQDGCDAFCSYCIVPYTRGRSRSLPLPSVLNRVSGLSGRGYREVVLCGIHIGRYGQDLVPKTSVAELLRALDGVPHTERIRLSSIEPMEITEEVVQSITASPSLCPHLHIPLQSGDDDILKAMNRPYTTAFYRDLIQHLALTIPHIAIGVDVMAGFPGETDKAFEHTYRLLEELPIAYLHVFPFSLHRGLPAEKLADRVPPQTIKDRCGQLRRLGQQKRLRFYDQFVGSVQEVLVEGEQGEELTYAKGFTRNYIPVLLEGNPKWYRQVVPVKITQVDRTGRVCGRALA